jgi:hypothetical protein
MQAFARAGSAVIVAAVAIGAIVFIAAPRGGGPPPVPSPSLAASPVATALPLPTLDATFVSPSYGYEIRYPSGWSVTPGSGSWPVYLSLFPGSPVVDAIVTPPGPSRVRISVASIALPRGMTMDSFRAFANPFSSPFDPDPCKPVAPLPGPVSLDFQAIAGESPQKVPAVISLNGCHALAEFGGSVYDLEAIAGGRGYEFILDGPISPADAQAWLATVKLEPATAAAASAPPSPSTSK